MAESFQTYMIVVYRSLFKFKCVKKTFFLSGLLISSTFVQAQEKTPLATDSTDKINLNEITISATRFKENSIFLPQKVVSINAAKIAAYNQQTTAELLSQSGEVLIQKSQLGGGSPIIRGFEANKILIVVDGVRMNNAIFRGGHLQNVITIDNAVLDKTEILFGPSSVIYGSDALGGVLSFYTKDPVLSDTAEKTVVSGNAFVRYASAYNERTGHFDLNVGGKKIASLTSITVSDFGDLEQGSKYYAQFPNWGKRNFYVQRINGVDSMVANSNPDKQIGTGYTQYDVLQKLLFKTGKLQHTLNFQFSTTSNISRYDRLTDVNAVGIARSAEWYYGPQKRLLAAWNVSLPSTNLYNKGQIVAAYQDVEESRHNRNYRNVNLNHREERVKIGSINADFFKKKGQVEVNYGAEITYNKVNSTAYAQNIVTGVRSGLDTRYPDGGSYTQSYAAYTTGLYKVSKKITVNGGLRFTHNRLNANFNDKTFFPFPFDNIEQQSDAVSGNLGIVALPGEGWKLSALVGTGFRTPNVDDVSKVFESGNGTLIIPNPNLEPEKSISYEVGVSKTVPKKLSVDATVWYSNLTNALSTDFSTLNGSSTVLYNGNTSNVITVVNMKKAFSWGVSANVNATLGKYVGVSSVFNYTYGRIRENPNDYPLDHVPPAFGKTSITGSFSELTVELFALYNAAKDSANYNLRGEDNQQYSADPIRGYYPGWATANFRAGYRLNRFASFQLAVENIFDKYYRVFASGLGAPGRNVVLTLRGNF